MNLKMRDDLELLRSYVSDRAEDAFAELVHRHVNLVYSAALRRVRSPQLAEEVAQSTFADLARNAHRLAPDTILSAWLYQVTRRTAIDIVRREARRQLREQIAIEMNTMNSTAADWTQIEPLLDDAMPALDDTDRTAVLLRYFENRTLREVGLSLGTTEDAAQKRVARAVERLREYFAKHGATIGVGGLVVVISANAVQAAPVGLAMTLVAAATLAGTALPTATAITVTKTVAMTTLQKALVTATVVVLTGAGIYQARQATR
ncbi:MAG: RNA polymerase sigma factor, partial [Limisphaerales bacterium]